VGYTATQKTVITGVEMFKKLLTKGEAEDNVGLLLRGTKKEEVERGRWWPSRDRSSRTRSFSGSVHSHEGRRWTAHAVLKGYRPQFYFRTTDVTGRELPREWRW